MNQIDFEEIGLTKNESRVYETLLKFGKLTSTEVSAKSGAPYGRIYDILGSLANKGLVVIIPDKIKKFIATSPDELIKIVEEKEKALRNIKEKTKELKQFYEQRESDVVEIAYGDKGFWKLADKTIESNDYSYSIKWDSKIKFGSLETTKKKIRKGIDIKHLVRFDKETKKNIKKWFKINPNIQQINNKGVAMSIVDDSEVMIGLIKSNTTLLIRDKPFAKIMKDLFLAKYKNAKDIKKQLFI